MEAVGCPLAQAASVFRTDACTIAVIGASRPVPSLSCKHLRRRTRPQNRSLIFTNGETWAPAACPGAVRRTLTAEHTYASSAEMVNVTSS